MQLVVNEWLPEYFLPAASREEKLLLQRFLQRFVERGDQIIVLRSSEFYRKIYRFAKESQDIYEIVTPIRNFIKLILEDSNRCLLIDNEEIVLPESVAEKLTVGNFSSDKYLFEASAASMNERIIVTTDVKLNKHFAKNIWCKVVLLPDFLKAY